MKQIAQAGTSGPAGIAGFLRIGGADYDAAAAVPSADILTPIYSTWGADPSYGSGWASASLPTEVGIVSS